MRFSLILSFLLMTFAVHAKKKESFPQIDSVVQVLENLKSKIIGAEDPDKLILNQQFHSVLGELLENYNTLNYDFSKLKSVSVLTGPKNRFRIYTWPLELSGESYDYYGFTQYLVKKKKKEIKVVTLENAIFDMAHEDTKSYQAEEWRGALYYQLVPSKKNSKKFVLLGWDGHNGRSTKKIIEVISFSRKGIPTFGAGILKFNVGSKRQVKYKTKFRVVFEYSNKVAMLLKYDKNLKMIVFDHLSPTTPNLKGVPAAYVPDFSYDGFVFKSGKWYMQTNVEAKNRKQAKPKKYKPSDYPSP